MSEPVVLPDGRVISQLQVALVAWDASGTELWRQPLGRPRWFGWTGGPALAEGGLIYAAALSGFYAFDLDRKMQWRTLTVPGDSAWFVGSPAIAPDRTIYTWGTTHVYAIFGTRPPDPMSPWPMWRHDAQRTGRVP